MVNSVSIPEVVAEVSRPHTRGIREGNLTLVEFERENLAARFPWSRHSHVRISQYSHVVAVVVKHPSTGPTGPHDEYEVYRVAFEGERNRL